VSKRNESSQAIDIQGRLIMEIKFNGQLTKKQFFKSVALISRPPLWNMILRLVLGLVFLAALVIYLVPFFLRGSFSSMDQTQLIRYLVSMSILLYFILIPYINSYLTAAKLWKDPIVREPQSGFVSNLGVSVHSGNNLGEIPWENFIRVRKTESEIVLLTSDGSLSVFPDQYFSSEQDWKTFQGWVDLNVVEAK
jgi:hypothetical protein